MENGKPETNGESANRPDISGSSFDKGRLSAFDAVRKLIPWTYVEFDHGRAA
jgi:hypothetical protein